MCAARKKSDKRLWTRNSSGAVHVQTVTTIQSQSSVGVDGQPIHVDPELLFQRLNVASNAIDDRNALFRFELCSYPSAPFDDTPMPRAPQKAVMANAVWTRFSTRHCRTNWRGSTCVGRWSIAPSPYTFRMS